MASFKSIITCKCPRCEEGNLFNHPNLYHPSHIIDMPETCSKCGQHYFMEPGFYFGAMYISYAISMGLGIGTFLILFLGVGKSIEEIAWVITPVLLILLPFIVRISRSVWLAIFYKGKRNNFKG